MNPVPSIALLALSARSMPNACMVFVCDRSVYIFVLWFRKAGSKTRSIDGGLLVPVPEPSCPPTQPKSKPMPLALRVRPRSTAYNTMNTGICTNKGRHPPSGLTLFSL